MEAGHRAARKGRKLGSSRRRQTREPAAGQDGPVAPGSWPSQAAEELQGFFQASGAAERGFVTREDLAVAKFSFLGSEEEPEMIFDWVDVERKGHLSLEEFSSGLKSIFGSSPSTQRVRGRRPLSSKRGSAAISFPVLEEADAEEKEAFLAFMEQLGGDHSLPEQEIWQLWGKLRQEEPQLAGNLEGFLAQMTSRLQEARADKEALELTLRKRDSDHQREVQQLYEEMEQQIGRQKQQLQAKSDSRDLALSSQMQEVLEAKEREVQQLAEGQRELEAELQRLSSAHREAGSEKLQLREAQRDLAGRLEQVQEQLQMTQGHLNFARSRVSWQVEEPSVPRAGEDKAPDPQAVSSEEAALPGLFEDNDDWDRLLRDPMGSEAPADPDYIYHIIFLGDSNVGKTSFLHLLHQNTFASGLTATVGVDFRVKKLLVDNKYYALQLWDTAGQERYHSVTRQLLRKADGVVLMYDVTSQESFAHVRYWLDCLQDAGGAGVVVLLLGNKMDCEEERQVSTEAGQQLAQELGLSFGECSAALGHNILEPMVNLARSLKRQEDLLKGSLVEVAPERPPKKAGCCS
uniref:RAB44, member RAS oncogene family n=1 Tax=Myotis myotis TaxID=51298 RepID=A0A7J7WXH6_MYOMY|nr:RAB44, member RAS oncogene family [Myotis myotis]